VIEDTYPSLATCWVRNPGVHSVELDKEAVLYDEPTGRLHMLNPSATLIWTCLDADVTGGELAAELADAFGVPLESMKGQVAEALEALAAEALIIDGGRRIP